MEWALLQFTSKGWSRPFPALDGPQTLLLVFGASGFMERTEPLHELRAAYPQAWMLGCSTAGEIFGSEIFDDTLSVAVVHFQRTPLRLSCSEDVTADNSRFRGEQLGAALRDPDLQAVFVLSDGLQVNGSELVRGLSDGAGPVVITGGLAGDGTRFKRTWVLVSRPGLELCVGPGRIAAVGLYGDAIHVGYSSRGGWDSFGIERRITRSRSNVLYELDGRPALELYKTYLGDLASTLPAGALHFPLSMRTEDPLEPQVVRTVLAVDEDAQSLTFAGDVPEGSIVTLMRCELDRLISGASQAAASCAQPGPLLSLAISCVGRRLVLGERTEEELEAVLEALPSGSSQAGFYSYGELSPLAGSDCRLHNQTMTLTTFQER